MKILIIMLLSLYGGIRGDRGFLDWEGYKGREINMNVILGGYLRFPYANLNLFFNYSSYSLSHSGNRITFYSFPAGGIELCAGKFPFFIGGEVSYGECRGWKINELSLETTKFYRSYTGKFLIIFKQTDHFDFFLNLFYKKIPDFENFNAYGISIGAFLRAPRTPKIKLETAETFPALLSFWQQKKPEGELYLAISNIGQKTVEDLTIQFKGLMSDYLKFSKTKPFDLPPAKGKEMRIKFKIKRELPMGKNPLTIVFKGKNYYSEKTIDVACLSSMNFAGDVDGTPYPEVEWEVLPSTYIKAGDTLTFRAKVKNSGDGKLYKFKAIIKSKAQVLNGKEIEIGYLPPGIEKTAEIDIPIPRNYSSRQINYKVEFFEFNDYVPPDIEGMIYVEEIERPKFTYARRIEEIVGVQDGKIQKGEGVKIIFDIKNVGIIAKNVEVFFDLAEETKGVDILQKAISIGDMGPGEEKEVSFRMNVKRVVEKDVLHFFLKIKEKNLGVEFTDTFQLTLEEPLKEKPMVIKQYFKGRKSPLKIYAGAGEETGVIAEIPLKESDILLATAQLKSWYKISLGELEGWVKEEDIEFTKPPEDKEITYKPPEIIKIYQQNPPTIVITNPPQGKEKTDREKYIIKTALFDDKGLSHLSFFYTQEKTRSLKIIPQSQKISGKSYLFEKEVYLREGKNIFKLVVYDIDSLKSEKEIIIERVPWVGKLPKIWAVVVGVSEYKVKSLNLKYTDEDAKAFYNILRSKYMANVPEEQIKLLINEKATAKNIKLALSDIFSKAGRNDLVIVYFALHGISEGDELYFLPYDADPNYIDATGIERQEVIRFLKRAEARKVVLIFDACHAGGFSQIAFARAGIESEINRLLKEIAKARDGIAVLSASRGAERSLELPQLGHGVFTYYLIEALKGKGDKDKDGYVRIEELYDYVYQNVSKLTNYKQHPDLSGIYDANLPLSIVRFKEEGK